MVLSASYAAAAATDNDNDTDAEFPSRCVPTCLSDIVEVSSLCHWLDGIDILLGACL